MILHRNTYLAAIGILFAIALSFQGCDTIGENPVGGMLASTSLQVVYWERAGSAFLGKAVRCIELGDDNRMYASVYDSGVFVSTNKGLNWADISQGLPDNPDIIRVRASKNTVLYAVSDTAVYRYTTATEEWERFTEGVAENSTFFSVTNDASRNPYLTTSTGLYMLAPDQQSWQSVTNGLPGGIGISGVDFMNDGRAAAISSAGDIYRSSDGQSGWVPVYLPFYVDSAYSVTLNPAGDLCILLRSRRLVVFRGDTEIGPSEILQAEEIAFYNGIGFLKEVRQKDSDPYSNRIRRFQMMRSIDGGLHWMSFYAGLQTAAIDFAFDAEGNGFAALSNGNFARTRVPVK